MEVYVEWIDMIGGERTATDGPFAFVEITGDDIRAQRAGEDDLFIGYRSSNLDEYWIRTDDESGPYTDIVISTVKPEDTNA